MFPFSSLLIFGILAAATGWFLSGWSVHKANRNEYTSDSLNNSTGDKVWFSLTTEQQKDLDSQASFIEQEEWIEDNIEVSLRSKLTPERIVLALANKAFISLGSGSPKRLANIVDLVKIPEEVVQLTFKQRKAAVYARLLKEERLAEQAIRRNRCPQPHIRFRNRF